MKTPHISAGLGRSLWLCAACAALLLLDACATRVEWTPQPDPSMAFGLEPGFAAWTNNVKSKGNTTLASLPLPDRLKLPDGNRLLPTWTGLSDDSKTPKSRKATTGTGYSQVGLASWYGPDFHGKLTANGETYNQNGMTAAHKTLPFNSMVRVKSLSTGRTVDVRINNRGPFVGGRIIDLSVGAAKALGTYEKGIAKVEIQRIK